jgi:DNA-binding CsgD family transcriptional regulator
MKTRGEANNTMHRLNIPPSRELTPFERLILALVCEGRSNSSIALISSHSEKVIENTVSRSAHVYGIKSDSETNLRVLLALAFRAHYGDKAFVKLDVACGHANGAVNGNELCNFFHE